MTETRPLLAEPPAVLQQRALDTVRQMPDDDVKYLAVFIEGIKFANDQAQLKERQGAG